MHSQLIWSKHSTHYNANKELQSPSPHRLSGHIFYYSPRLLTRPQMYRCSSVPLGTLMPQDFALAFSALLIKKTHLYFPFAHGAYWKVTVRSSWPLLKITHHTNTNTLTLSNLLASTPWHLLLSDALYILVAELVPSVSFRKCLSIIKALSFSQCFCCHFLLLSLLGLS